MRLLKFFIIIIIPLEKLEHVTVSSLSVKWQLCAFANCTYIIYVTCLVLCRAGLVDSGRSGPLLDVVHPLIPLEKLEHVTVVKWQLCVLQILLLYICDLSRVVSSRTGRLRPVHSLLDVAHPLIPLVKLEHVIVVCKMATVYLQILPIICDPL